MVELAERDMEREQEEERRALDSGLTGGDRDAPDPDPGSAIRLAPDEFDTDDDEDDGFDGFKRLADELTAAGYGNDTPLGRQFAVMREDIAAGRDTSAGLPALLQTAQAEFASLSRQLQRMDIAQVNGQPDALLPHIAAGLILVGRALLWLGKQAGKTFKGGPKRDPGGRPGAPGRRETGPVVPRPQPDRPPRNDRLPEPEPTPEEKPQGNDDQNTPEAVDPTDSIRNTIGSSISERAKSVDSENSEPNRSKNVLSDRERAKSARSFKKLVDEHQRKLDQYSRDPDAHDNQGRLKRAKSPEHREAIIKGRKETLRKAIERHRKNTERADDGE